jgi:regulator of protease activity HflC (stomatin/prohibitin superfamily)
MPTITGLTSVPAARVTRTQLVSEIGITAFVLSLAAGGALTAWLQQPWPMIVFVLVGAYLLFSIKVATQWEKAALLRLGVYRGLRGPGLFTIVPIIDTVSLFVDQRIRVTEVKAESTLTRDAVPVFVDAIVFWLVWNAEKSILEVQDFVSAIQLSAQTALRESTPRPTRGA